MPKSLKLIVEALLFASDRPLSVKDFRSWLPDAEPAGIRSALKVLKYEYEAMGRSFNLREVAGGYQFRSHSDFGPYILRMLQATPARLSRAALETLAIIAYKQPIVRHEIERVRGVESGGILRNLLEKDLIRIMGRKDLPGRPLIYGTTRRFLEVFDLDSIDSLPKLKEIKAFGNEDHGTENEAPVREEALPQTEEDPQGADGERVPEQSLVEPEAGEDRAGTAPSPEEGEQGEDAAPEPQGPAEDQ
ncbi:MAG: SMC-Scp complex subunit ScpB [Deltaproteobacteria bacterium]|nr:SMC-Scp complex subunit ScpB [Deltaproteobacteria bacterium]